MEISNIGIFKGMNKKMSILSIFLILLSVAITGYFPLKSAIYLKDIREFLNPFLEWYYVLLVAFLLAFMIWLGMGRYKNVRLGGDLEQPEFTFFSWVSMLFAAGTGVGILFWSVAQPIIQFQNNPFTSSAMTPEAAITGMSLSFFHWGLNGWAIFSFIALTMAYFSFRHDYPLTIRSALYPIFGRKVDGILGDFVDILAVFGTVFGIATTLGLGVEQMNAGLKEVLNIKPSLFLQLGVMTAIMIIATISVVSGVNKGVKLLSIGNFWLSIIVLLFLLVFGPTQYLIGVTVEATGHYIQNIVRLTFHTNVTHDTNWQSVWTVFFWGWWIAWSPFVGMFIARISRGRTIGEFVAGVLLTPTLITIVWIGLFGGTALYEELFLGKDIVAAVNNDISSALFVMLENLEVGILGEIMSFLMIVLIATYLITSANAGTLVITTILSAGSTTPPAVHRVLWGIILTLLTGVLILAGGLETLQAAVITAALPFSVIIIIMIAGLLKSLSLENTPARSGNEQLSAREPWILDEDVGEEPTIMDEFNPNIKKLEKPEYK
ncbi:BCCT family transporter [Malaciobacter marinus]|uniref:BCCT (Betaine/carnitine/choline) family transporter n=1 Tax=Malaciobacter marinus TaxID=505249 RepID=A0A347TK20_9BACT|nr:MULTISPECIES: BCCT family transporter [Malaciobacter]AXX86948.1 BCCT (betaine/carnitine/choline) family transporter [Malaciobacter marinus]PHO15901.1 choline transporter [Malaciobacter marinus]RYA23104.1 BCCT family transporter [Malaciobacter halophilus]